MRIEHGKYPENEVEVKQKNIFPLKLSAKVINIF